jgi:hypothetical protein
MPALLAIWHDVDPGVAAAYDAWYDEEHFPERLSCPGFINGQRFKAIDAMTRPQYLAFYEVTSLDVLTSPAYRGRLENPTERTREVIAGFRNTIRGACRVRFDMGTGSGLYCATLALDGAKAGGRLTQMAEAIAKRTGVRRLRIVEGDAAATGPVTAEQRLRGQLDRPVPLTAIVEMDTHADLGCIGALHPAEGESVRRYQRLRFAVAPA